MIGFVISDTELEIDGLLCEDLSKKFQKYIYLVEDQPSPVVLSLAKYVPFVEVVEKGFEKILEKV